MGKDMWKRGKKERRTKTVLVKKRQICQRDKEKNRPQYLGVKQVRQGTKSEKGGRKKSK